MKKRWYRNTGAKVILGVAAAALLTVSAVGVSVGFGCADAGIEMFDDSEYFQSRTFARELYTDGSVLLSALNAKDFVGDGTGEIDLQEVFEAAPLTHKETSGLAYAEKDLAEWAEIDWDDDDMPNVLECTQTDGTPYYMYYDEFRQKISDGDLKLKFSDSDRRYLYYEEEGESPQEVILSMLKEADYSSGATGIADLGVPGVTDKNGKTLYNDIKNYGWDGSVYNPIREAYKPVGADSLLDAVNENSQWQGRLSDAYSALSQVLYTFANTAGDDQELSRYEEGKTNLSYIYINQDSGAFHTNTGETSVKTLKDVQKLMERSGYSYMIVTPEDGSSNIESENYNIPMWRHMADSTTDNADYIWGVAVDKTLPIADRIARNQDTFYAYSDWMTPALIGAAGAFLLFLISLGFFTAGMGRTNNDEEIHLNFFDRWYTEIAAAAVIALAAGALFAVVSVMEPWAAREMSVSEGYLAVRDVSVSTYMIVFGAAALTFVLFFLFGWASLVKRIKAHTFWKNSLIRKILLFLKKGFFFLAKGVKETVDLFSRNTVSRVKMTVIFGGFCLFQFVVCGMFFASGSLVLLLVLAAADIAALYYLLKKARGRELILDGLKKITDGDLQYKIPLDQLTGEQRTIADYINRIGEGLDAAVENSMKNERMKTELITNVSHDIKTPLTSIINYVDLLKRENPTDPKIKGYLDILEEKAHRLKTLTEDVVEASKASTGNISLEMVNLNFVELVQQVIGEFEEHFQERNLSLMVHFDEEEAIICADGRRLWRVLENVFGNAAKYVMENTTVYAEVKVEKSNVIFSLKNITAQPLNISADEPTEPFIRGDDSRNTEGSGLGLSIAKSLTELQNGEFRLYLDGDLFKVTIVFKAN